MLKARRWGQFVLKYALIVGLLNGTVLTYERSNDLCCCPPIVWAKLATPGVVRDCALVNPDALPPAMPNHEGSPPEMRNRQYSH